MPLVLLLLDTQHYGTLIELGLFAKWLSVVLVVGGACYLVDLLAAFLLPALAQKIHAVIEQARRRRGVSAATAPPALLQWSHGHAARPPDRKDRPPPAGSGR